MSQTERNLKIEADGDKWIGIKPKIRLMGHWLERAGFKPGNRVQVIPIATGIIELRASETESNPREPEILEVSNEPF